MELIIRVEHRNIEFLVLSLIIKHQKEVDLMTFYFHKSKVGISYFLFGTSGIDHRDPNVFYPHYIKKDSWVRSQQ